MTEYFLVRDYLLFSKQSRGCVLLGALFCLAGQAFRIGAFVAARSNFNHLIQLNRKSSHQLVRSGVYSLSRHPSYLGFFLTQVGNQLLLMNLFSQLLSVLVTYRFFLFRIEFEEVTLHHFFPDYAAYVRETGIGIPFMQTFLDRRQASRAREDEEEREQWQED